MRAVAKDVLTLLGIVWLAVGVLDILRVLVTSDLAPNALRSGCQDRAAAVPRPGGSS